MRPVNRSLTFVGILLAALILSVQVVSSQTIDFRDTYTRLDVALPEDSLGTTEPGPGLVELDYRELGGCCGRPGVANIARIEEGKLIVHGEGTTPTWVELDNAGFDIDLTVEAEFLHTDFLPADIGTDMTVFMRNAGTGTDSTIFTTGLIIFAIHVDGYYQVRSTPNNMGGLFTIVEGIVDGPTFEAADLNHDGRLETGETFNLHLVLDGDSFSFSFNGVGQLSNLDLSGLVAPPTGSDRLLLGRNRWQDGVPYGVAVRFDNLVSGQPVQTVQIDVKPGSDLNCFNNDGHGVIPVAILTTEVFDAATVDAATVTLDDADVRVKGKGGKCGSLKDVDGDGDLDLVVQIEDVADTYGEGDTLATLTGLTLDGDPFMGTDTLCIVR